MIVTINAAYYAGAALLRFGWYYDGSVAIQGVDVETEEPLFTATVCLDEPAQAGHVWLKGWSENEGIPESLEAAGVLKLTGRTARTGFVAAEEAKLTEAMLQETVT